VRLSLKEKGKRFKDGVKKIKVKREEDAILRGPLVT